MKKTKVMSAAFIARAAMIAAIYVVLTILFAPISFSEVQVRISESLTILPLFTPAAIPGLLVGCIIANSIGGAIIWDILFGSLATLIGAVGGYLLRRNRWLVPIPTIVSNTVIIPLILRFGYGVNLPIPILMLSIAAGEFISCYILGELLATILKPHSKFIFGETDAAAENGTASETDAAAKSDAAAAS